MSIMRVLKSRIVAGVGRTDFIGFFQSAFHVLEPGSTLNLNWHHYTIAYYLELVRRGVIKRLIILAPPRLLKSLMASVAFPAWVLGHDPTARIIGISHGSDLQIKFNNEFRRLVESPRYRTLFPAMETTKNTETEVHTSRGGYRFARSVEGSLTGIGGRYLILDDYQKPLDMTSEARRTATNALYYSTIASRIDNQHSGAIVVVGHRLGPNDLIGTLLASTEKWTVLDLPAIAETDERIPIGGGRYHVRRVGDLLHPEQQSLTTLEALKIQDPEIYWAQHQQRPIPPGGFMIKRNQIQYCDELPKRSSSDYYLQTWDTAEKQGKANARSAGLDILVHDNKYFIARALVGQWDYDELQERVLSRANEQKPNAILIEDTGFGTALISVLKKKGLPVISVKPEGDKESRLRQQMDKFHNGQVFLLKHAPGRADLEIELFSFPGGQHNDLVDALSQALAHKYVRCLWTDEAVENYNKVLGTLMAMAPRRRFP
jgi:predicted phage terminase large subunit-like protein